MSCPHCGHPLEDDTPSEDAAIAEAITAAAEADAERLDLERERIAADAAAAHDRAEIESERIAADVAIAETQAEAAVAIAEAQAAAEIEAAEAIAEAAADLAAEDDGAEDEGAEGDAGAEDDGAGTGAPGTAEQTPEAGGAGDTPAPVAVPPQLEDDPAERPRTARGRRVSRFRARTAHR